MQRENKFNDLQAMKGKQQEINDMMINTLRAAVATQSQPVRNMPC